MSEQDLLYEAKSDKIDCIIQVVMDTSPYVDEAITELHAIYYVVRLDGSDFVLSRMTLTIPTVELETQFDISLLIPSLEDCFIGTQVAELERYKADVGAME